MKKIGIVLILWVIVAVAPAQKLTTQLDSLIAINKDSANKIFTIGTIRVIGNKKTKEYIILREMTFRKGDTISAGLLPEKIQRSRELIYNTGLFVDDSVKVIQQQNNVLQIEVAVKERWYFFPLPYIKPVDRNINQWIVQEHASLDRVNYGIKFMHNNLTGQNDKLNIWLITGYNQQITVRYNLPFINTSLTKGFEVGFTTSRQHEINYATSDSNKQQFLKLPDEFARHFTRYDLTYFYRPDQKQRHYFRVSYTDENISDSVFKTNPNYYPQNRTGIKYVDFLYAYRYLNADYFVYPTKGFMGEVNIYKRGLDNITDLWQLSLHGVYSTHISKRAFASIESAAAIKFPYTNSFYAQPLFGYGYFTLRGQEYYVVDGMAGALTKFTVTQEIFKYIFHNPIKSKTHDKIPFRFYLKAFYDMGYAYSPYATNNLLNNKFMYTYGFGVDVVSIYDFVIRFNIAFNQLGDKDLYLHARNDF
jgi:outer membrane protein assembly factor BamA